MQSSRRKKRRKNGITQPHTESVFGLPLLDPSDDLLEVILDVVGGVRLKFVDDLLVVRLTRLVQNRLKDFALEIVFQLFMIVILFLQPIEEFRRFSA